MVGDTLDDDYSGPFDSEWSLERLSRNALARLCREYMVVAFYHDRALMPFVAIAHGTDATIVQADAEWMGSSPIYTARNKNNLEMNGDGAGDALKSFQFDVGAAHYFMDFQFEDVDHDLGYFWLPFCGAHHYVRKISNNDEQLVINMCHHMEDRSFDATLGITNPKLRAIPMDAQLVEKEGVSDAYRVWKISMANIDDQRTYGWIAVPNGDPFGILTCLDPSGSAQNDDLCGQRFFFDGEISELPQATLAVLDIDGELDPGFYYAQGGKVGYDGFSLQFGFRYTFGKK